MNLRFKKIKDYSSEELEFAIGDAIHHCNNIPVDSHLDQDRQVHLGPVKLDFWRLFRGFDAYMEKRRRKEDLEVQRSTKALSHDVPYVDNTFHPKGFRK